MRSANILFKDEIAGVITQQDDGTFTFKYNTLWVNNHHKPAISLSLPKSTKALHSTYLFPFFFNIIPEGNNKQLLCTRKRIDTDNYFIILLEVSSINTIGGLRVIKN